MSETTQEDLSVEDILSSIKNILTDDTNAPQENALELPASKQEEIEPEPIEDILNLDDSMIVDETKDISSTIEPSPEETPVPVEEKKEVAPDIKMTEQTPAPTLENKEQEDDTLNLADSIDIEQTLKMAEDINFDDIPALEGLIKQETPAKEEPLENNTNDETTDASANIINNFAKVFAEKRQEKNKSESTNLEKTISSNFGSSNITTLIEKTILEQVKINMDSHFTELASTIIAKQTREWLDENLITIVEKTVAKEIERVIAKVGS